MTDIMGSDSRDWYEESDLRGGWTDMDDNGGHQLAGTKAASDVFSKTMKRAGEEIKQLQKDLATVKQTRDQYKQQRDEAEAILRKVGGYTEHLAYSPGLAGVADVVRKILDGEEEDY